MFDSLQRYGLLLSRLLYSWVFPGKNAGLGCHALLQGIFPTQGSNLLFSLFFFPNLRLLHLLHWQAGSLLLVPPGKPL